MKYYPILYLTLADMSAAQRGEPMIYRDGYLQRVNDERTAEESGCPPVDQSGSPAPDAADIPRSEQAA